MTSPTKVFLLYPPISKRERYSSSIGAAGGEQIPLGIYSLAAYLRAHGFAVTVLDAEAQRHDIAQVLERVARFAPDHVGISSTTVAFHRALQAAEGIRQNFPRVPITLGGPHVTSNVEHAMSFDLFDYGVLREGEATFKELLEALDDHRDLASVKGLAHRGAGGCLIVNQPREYLEDLDQLPFPAYDLIDDVRLYTPPPSNYKALPVINVITSRGCPSACTFCDRNVFGRTYRERSAENVVEELQLLAHRYQAKEIAFVDDTFLINKKRIHRIFELLDQARMSFHWTCMSRINNVDREFLEFIHSKGCWHLSFGIESGDEDILKLIKKNITLERTRQVIGWCREIGIKTKGFFMIGHPGETEETMAKTIEFACALPLDDLVATVNTPIPGSPQYADVDRYGTLDRADWSQFNYWRPVFVPHGLSQALLLSKQKEMYRRFYMRPRILLRYGASFLGAGGLRRFTSVVKAARYLFES